MVRKRRDGERRRKVEGDHRRETAQQRQRRGGPSLLSPPRSWERVKISKVNCVLAFSAKRPRAYPR